MSELMTKTVQFTQRERQLIRNALTIAAEDGSIYGGAAETDEEMAAVNREIEAIEAKLMTDSANPSAPPAPPETTAPFSNARARELFDRARAANDPDTRDILSAAAWYYADKLERDRAGSNVTDTTDIVRRLRKQRAAQEVGEPCARWVDAVDAADQIVRLRELARKFGDDRDNLRHAAQEAHDNGDVEQMRAILAKALEIQ